LIHPKPGRVKSELTQIKGPKAPPCVPLPIRRGQLKDGCLRYHTFQELKSDVIDTRPSAYRSKEHRRLFREARRVQQLIRAASPCPGGDQPGIEPDGKIPDRPARKAGTRPWYPGYGRKGYIQFVYIPFTAVAREQKFLCHDLTYFVETIRSSAEWVYTTREKSRECMTLLRTLRRVVERLKPMVTNLGSWWTAFEYALRIRRQQEVRDRNH